MLILRSHFFFVNIFSFCRLYSKKTNFLSIFTIFIYFSFIFFSCFYFYFLTLFLVCSIRDSFLTDFVLSYSWIFGIFYNYFLSFLCTLYSDYVEYIYGGMVILFLEMKSWFGLALSLFRTWSIRYKKGLKLSPSSYRGWQNRTAAKSFGDSCHTIWPIPYLILWSKKDHLLFIAQWSFFVNELF